MSYNSRFAFLKDHYFLVPLGVYSFIMLFFSNTLLLNILAIILFFTFLGWDDDAKKPVVKQRWFIALLIFLISLSFSVITYFMLIHGRPAWGSPSYHELLLKMILGVLFPTSMMIFIIVLLKKIGSYSEAEYLHPSLCYGRTVRSKLFHQRLCNLCALGGE